VGFEKHMYDDMLRQARLKTDLREAFERQEFAVWYQAVVDLQRGSMTGVEALVRWNHPERGLLPPDEFIPQVAAMGLLPQLTRFVLGEACGWAQHRRARLPHEVPLTVAVNVSPHDLLTSEVVEDISEALAESGLPASLLTIEVTETETFDNLEQILPRLMAIRAMGVLVAVDDFGTGYSSLSHLQGLPVDLVKIDKSFVDGLATSLEDSTVVAAVVRLAHTMGLSVVAEGVEQVKQLLALRELGCEFVQGYLLARPAPGDAVPEPGEIEQRLTGLGVAHLPPAPTSQSFSVLVADDAEDERRLLRRVLERSGRFTVVAEAADGIEAVTGASALRPALVLLDLDMPRLDGMSALPLIVAQVPTTRVVVLSGHATDARLDQARRAGAAGCMQKGVADIPALLLKILGAVP